MADLAFRKRSGKLAFFRHFLILYFCQKFVIFKILLIKRFLANILNGPRNFSEAVEALNSKNKNPDLRHGCITAFLMRVLDNPNQILGTGLCTMSMIYLDKEFAATSLEHDSFDGVDTFTVSSSKYLLDVIKKHSNLDDSELGKFVRETMNREPLKYNGEFDNFLSLDETLACKLIFNNWFRGCYGQATVQ